MKLTLLLTAIVFLSVNIAFADNIDSMIVKQENKKCSTDIKVHLYWYCGNYVLHADSIYYTINGDTILLKVRYPDSWATAVSYPDTLITLSNIPSGNYTIKCVLYRDASWLAVDSSEKNVQVPKSFYFHPFSLADMLICTDNKKEIVLDAFTTGVASYSWLPDEETSSSIVVNTPGKYIVSVIDTAGCPGKDSVMVTEKCPTKLFIPNSFTPNNDGVNDVFLPKGEFILEYNLNIYDRWGHVVFQSSSVDNGWNGNSNSTEIPQGIYVYSLSYAGDDGNQFFKKSTIGKVTLVR